MKFEIRSIFEKGDLQKERVTLRCLDDSDIGEYVLFQTGTTDGSVNTDVKRAMWFPDKLISKGDIVVLYSRNGSRSEKTLTTGKKVHFFYWGFDSAIWSNPELGLVLLHAPDWQFRLSGDM